MPELGLIEGFYGKPWTWAEREETISFLARHGGYGFYLYAPKADLFLRRRWEEAHPAGEAEAMASFASSCRGLGVRFGVGLTPFELRELTGASKEALARKLDFLDQVGIVDLAILFDDMRGDLPELADRQAEIVAWAAGRTRAERVIVCPSYYTDDPVLDRAFGQRPAGYLDRLGALLDPAIEIMWTGEEVCSRELSAGHLARVAERIGRKPFIWDNYPVNDGQRMSQFLHLRAFTGRRPEIASHLSAHGVNPALQPTLTRIPMLTLRESYEMGAGYRYGEAFERAAVEVMGAELGARLREDLLILQDVGLDRLGEREALLRERWGGVDHPAAREIVGWLDGAWRITDEIVQTQ